MKKNLRPYQKLMIDFALDVPRCGLLARMGLGKTVSTATYLSSLSILDRKMMPALVIAPYRVAVSIWPQEFKDWPHLHGMRVSAIVGDRQRREAALRTRADVYTTNYEQLPWLTEYLGEDWPFRVVIADESSRLKNHRAHFRIETTGRRTLVRTGTIRARAISKVAIKKVKRWVNLSGTPTPNGLQDLWGQTWFLDFGQRLGTQYDAFEQRYFKKGYMGYGLEPLEHTEKEIQDKLRDICITLKPEDYFDLPPVIENEIYVDMPPVARKHYTDMEKNMFASLSLADVEAFNAGAKTMKLLQFANGAAYINEQKDWEVIHDEKIDALKSVIEEAAGAPVMVAYHFKSDLARLKKAFPKGRVLDKHPQTIIDWNKGRIPVLFAHPESAGHGLNLQFGSNILAFFSLNWNFEAHDQIIERMGPVRQVQAGLDRPLHVHYILSRDTVDEQALERLRTKRSVQDIFMNAMRKKYAM